MARFGHRQEVDGEVKNGSTLQTDRMLTVYQLQEIMEVVECLSGKAVSIFQPHWHRIDPIKQLHTTFSYLIRIIEYAHS